ncbi:ribokinase [Spirochaetia bacterium]|nr:ribokinase [Spirochaetia bacterium]
MKSRIMVYGSYCVGMTMSCKTFPAKGQTVLGKDFCQLHGGKGSNQAIAAARLGGDVCFVSCVGKDSLGDAAIALFKEEGIRSRVKRSEKNATGVGFVMVEESGQNRIIINFDAVMEVGPEDIDALENEWADCKVLLMQFEADLPTVAYAAKRAKEKGVCVILNPAPYQPFPEELLKSVDIITPNETEAKQMLGIAPDAGIPPEELGKKLLASTGIKEIIITLGEEGALLVNKAGMRHIPADKSFIPVDTTGAGDTFAGGLAVAIGEGLPLDKAIAFANTAASISVTKYGVVESIPSREDVDKVINKL